MKRLLQAAAFLVTLLTATAALAATAMVTTTLHLRTGPGPGYRIVASMPDGAVVDVPGCARGYNWCRVDWNGYRGWASASYLAFRHGRYRRRPFARYGAEIGIPLVAGAVIGNAFGHHHDHYRHRLHHERRRIRHLRHQRRHLRRELRHARHRDRHRRRHHRRHVVRKYCNHHPHARACH